MHHCLEAEAVTGDAAFSYLPGVRLMAPRFNSSKGIQHAEKFSHFEVYRRHTCFHSAGDRNRAAGGRLPVQAYSGAVQKLGRTPQGGIANLVEEQRCARVVTQGKVEIWTVVVGMGYCKECIGILLQGRQHLALQSQR